MRRHQDGNENRIANTRPMPLVRGVVVGVRFADQQEERAAAMRQRDPKFASYGVRNVAVDVLTYGASFRSFLGKVPVLPRRHGLNDYEGLWIPRAATRDLSTGGAPIYDGNLGRPSDPRDLDGDHVLVEFLEGDPTQPFVRDEMPHPRTKYTQLAAAGEAQESRFRGVVSRIDKDGNVSLDTTQANSGQIDTEGAETPANDASHGNVTVKIGALTKLKVLNASGQNVLELDPDGSTTIVTLGPGTSFAVKYAELQTLYTNLVVWLAAHTHPDGWGSTAPPLPMPLNTAWDVAIKAANLKIPSES